MVMLTCICDKLITPDQIPYNNEATQHINSPDSSNSHEKPEFPKALSIPHQQNSNTNFQNMQHWNQFSNMQIANQYPLFTLIVATYQRRTKLELSKVDGSKKYNVAWFNKAKEYFKIYGIDNDDEKIRDASPCKWKAKHIIGICGGKRQHTSLAGENLKMHSLKDSKV